MASFRLSCLFMIAVQVFLTDAQCPGTLTASNTPQLTSSPNYPDMYPADANCRFLIRTSTIGNVIMLESVDVDLYNANGDCSDSITVYDGGNDQAPMLGKFCGMNRVMLKSSGQNVYVVFSSDGSRQGKGYSMRYWTANDFNPVCNGVAEVGMVPVFMRFPSSNSPVDCKYTLRAPQNYILKLDLLDWHMPASMDCNRGGNIKVTDAGRDIIDQCGPERPFWHLTSSGRDLDVTLTTTLVGESKPFYVKIYPMNTIVTTCVEETRIGPMSSFFYFPHIQNAVGSFCSKTLAAPGTTARVEVVGSMCNDTYMPSMDFQLREDGELKSFQCIGGRPVYSSAMQDLQLFALTGSTPSLLKVASFESYCGAGAQPNNLAMPKNDSVMDLVLKNIQRDSHCSHKIMADEGHRVELELTSTLQDSNDCVMVKHAMKRSGEEMMEKYCGKFGPIVFTSMDREITFTVMTNDRNSMGELHIRYYSFSNTTLCHRRVELLATRTKKTLMTPNYPAPYPLNAICSWSIVSYRPDFVVVVEVEESDLPSNCADMGYVNDGELDNHTRLGEWCGERTPMYRSTGQTLLLTFDADHMMTMHNGFKFKYYADYSTPREIEYGTDVMTIAAVFTIIILAGGIIFIMYRCCVSSRQRRKARKADRQPLAQ